MIDFNKLSRPKATAAPLDPAEIFAKTPNLSNAPNSLWAGQAEALRAWHKHRENEDIAIFDLFGSDLPEEAFAGVFDQKRPRDWRKIDL